MTEALKMIVDGYLSLKDRKALEELRAHLAGKVGKHELPAALEFVTELPRTSVGKRSVI